MKVEGKALAAVAEEAQKILESVALKLHGDTELPLVSQGLIRRAVVHTPPGFDPQKPHHVLVTADSFTVNKVEPTQFGPSSLTGMSKTNGLDEMADRNGIVNLHLFHVPVRAAKGLTVSAWQSEGAGLLKPGGFLNKARPEYDDATYGAEAVGALAQKMNIRSLSFAGYAEGAEFMPNLMSAVAKSDVQAPLNSAAFVSGTRFGTEAPIPSGLHDVTFVHGTGDRNFPLSGGPGLVTKLLVGMGHTNVRTSSVEGMFSEVQRSMGPHPVGFHGDRSNDRWFWQGDLHTYNRNALPNGNEQVWKYPDGRTMSFVTLDKVGSTWPGRNFGPEHESQVSKFNGNRSDFNINDRIAEMIKRNGIGRLLAATA
jgi:hypothetical protein